MSRYDHDYYDSNDCNCGGKRKASATAKTALGLAIGGLSLAAVNGGLLGGNNGCDCTGNNGGLLGNLFEIVAILAIAKRNMNKVLVL